MTIIPFDQRDGWIWFNGEIAGEVALWRIHPDGSGAEKMTADDRANWFPHPSPDGADIVYLAYGRGVKGHPRDQDVELRLMPSAGGAPKTLLSLFGGQ
eukprot:gene29291-29715_t